MKIVYISDTGDDKNDGLTHETAVYSWKRAVAIADGNTEFQMTDATLKRVTREIGEKKS